MRSPCWVAMVAAVLLGPPALNAEDSGDLVRAYIRSRAAREAHLPSFSRQTGLACSACHYQFLALTPFGREFKLKGYTLTARN